MGVALYRWESRDGRSLSDSMSDGKTREVDTHTHTHTLTVNELNRRRGLVINHRFARKTFTAALIPSIPRVKAGK